MYKAEMVDIMTLFIVGAAIIHAVRLASTDSIMVEFQIVKKKAC